MFRMAWRLDEAIEHGIIDNTVEGITSGKIWLAGRDEPLILSLNGDCWRDLAGTTLEFENPHPRVFHELNNLDTEQTGTVGDITASLKMRMSEIAGDGFSGHQNSCNPPCQWRNIFYLEWFSEANGRVLVEAPDFKLEVSERAWEMDEDLEEAQKLANMNSMRDFMAQIIGREEFSEESPPMKVRGELDEFEWEERLKESDRLTDAYQEVLEKYMDDPDAERKEAFVMGWDGLLSAMADRDEDRFDEESDEDDEVEAWHFSDSDDQDEETDEDFSGHSHPLQCRAHEIALRSFDIVNCSGEPAEAEPAQVFTSKLMQISVKLAGVLTARDSGYGPETGFVLAVLKRCMSWINDAIGSCNELIELEEDADQVAALEHLRTDIFEIRDGIIELRRELKQS